jgi:hypothetical protein
MSSPLLLIIVMVIVIFNVTSTKASAVAAPPMTTTVATTTRTTQIANSSSSNNNNNNNLLTTTTTTTASGGDGDGGGGNMIVGLFTYLKDSMVRTVQGCGQLWTNHGKCNEIRKKQSEYRNQIKTQWEEQGLYEAESPKQIRKRLQQVHGGISYEEYRFLQKGKDDRAKVLNMAFLMWGAPRFLPYALMFNPEMLPSTFQMDKPNTKAAVETLARERANAIIMTLMQMERQAIIGTGGFLTSLNVFGKKKQQEKKELLETIVTETGSFFRRELPTAPAMPNASELLLQLAPHLYRTDSDFSRAEQRLCQIPSVIIHGIGRAVAGTGAPGIVDQLIPAVFKRGRLVGHIQKVTAADDFLVQAQIDLKTISKRLLREACQERLMDAGPHRSAEELRDSLSEWLQLVVEQPAASVRLLAQNSAAVTDGSAAVYFNGNLARLALMAYYGCAAVRDPRSSSRLPHLLYKGNQQQQQEIIIKSPSNDRGGRLQLKKIGK